MVHCFYYNHDGRNIHFLYDVESGSLLNVDNGAYLVAKRRWGQLSDEEAHNYEALDKSQVAEIEGELLSLIDSNVLDTADNIVRKDKSVGEIKALCLHICHDCNMRCKYCFADEGHYGTAHNYMSETVGIKAIDFLIAHSGKRNNLEVDFFGGEPLMNLEVVKSIVQYARSREQESGKKFSFTMTTNCLLLSDDTIEWLDKEMHNIVLSIDGRREVHNNVRKTVNGKDAYEVVLRNAIKMAQKRGDKSYYVRGTFTHDNLDFSQDVLFLRDCGFDQISVEPVVLDKDNSLAIRDDDISTICQEYRVLAREYLQSRKTKDKWFNFFHFMLDLDGGPCINKRLTGCGAGCEYLAVTPTGGIYPCHQFADKQEYCFGNVLSGDFDITKSQPFAKNIVTNKVPCQDCVAKYFCSGGCVANAINFEGDMAKAHEQTCKIMRARFEIALAISAIEKSL